MHHLVLSCLVALSLVSRANAQSLELTHAGTLDISALGLNSVGDLAMTQTAILEARGLWVSDSSSATNEIHRLDPATGVSLFSYDASVVPGLTLGPDALAQSFWGVLFVFSSFGQDEAGSVTATGTLDDTFASAQGATAAATERGSELYVAKGPVGGPPELLHLSPFDGSVLSTVTLSGIQDRIADMAFDPTTDRLYCLLESTNTLVEVDHVTGASLSLTLLPGPLTTTNSISAGMTFDEEGGRLYVSKGEGLEAGRIHVFERPLPADVCLGDGSGAACPCGNFGAPARGCANSLSPLGARLESSGIAQVANDSVSLVCTLMPAGVACTYFQGSVLTPPQPFGDGLRCAGGQVVRLATMNSSLLGFSLLPASSDAPVSVLGAVPPVGGERIYQVSYRNSATFCTPATFNASNGRRIVWAP